MERKSNSEKEVLMKGLYFNLIGVIKDASFLSRSLRNHRSIRVMRDSRDDRKEFALVTFLRAEDGHFTSPTTELTEKNIDYFLIQAVNTYRGSTIIVKTGTEERSKEIRLDRKGNQRCNIRSAGTVMRVSQNGQVEVFRVTSPTVANKKQINIFTIYEENLPFENPGLLDVIIQQNETLAEFNEDLKKAYAAIKERKFENKMDLSQAKYRHIQSRREEPKEYRKVEIATEPGIKEEAPVEKPEAEPKAAPKEKAAKRNPDEKNTATQVKTARVKDQKREAEKEIEDAKAEKEDEKSSPVKAEAEKSEMEKIQKKAQDFGKGAFAAALQDAGLTPAKTQKKKPAKSKK